MRSVPLSMAETLPKPPCQYCKREMHLAGDDDHSWQFVCLVCGCIRVYTKRRATLAAKAEVLRRRSEAATERLRQLRARPKYFLMPGLRGKA